MAMERDRVISISLTEAEWRAFIARQPQPVDWLRARILDEVEGKNQFTIDNLQVTSNQSR
jgi:hypothetical protein